MPTFRSKEVVDAWQFTGEIDNAKELVARVKAEKPDYRRSELRMSQGVYTLGSSDPAIEAQIPCLHIDFGDEPKDWWSLQLNIGDWLVRKQDGRFVVDYDENFKHTYDQV